MTPHPRVLQRHDTVAEAMRLLLDHRLLAAPIVEADGRYFGMFARSKLISLLLPQAVRLMETRTDQGRWLDFGYLPDTLDDLRARYQVVAGDPVDKHALLDTPRLRPDTPLMNALLFLYRNRSLLPVVEERTGKLLGVVSTWDALARIADAAPGK